MNKINLKRVDQKKHERCAVSDLADLVRRFEDFVANTCSKAGCDKCNLKWPGGCRAIELSNKLHDKLLKEFKQIPGEN